LHDIKLPPFNEASERLRGRNIRAGYQRGWGLQFGDLHGQVLKDDLYQHAFSKAKTRTVVAEWNRMNLYLILKYGFKGLAPGHILEFGAYRGGNAIFMAEVCKALHPGTKVYATPVMTNFKVSFKGPASIIWNSSAVHLKSLRWQRLRRSAKRGSCMSIAISTRLSSTAMT
jgi:hypothetical protein